MYSEMVVEDNWEPTPWPPDVRACAVPDVLPVSWFAFWIALGAVVVVAALGLWAVNRLRAW